MDRPGDPPARTECTRGSAMATGVFSARRWLATMGLAAATAVCGSAHGHAGTAAHILQPAAGKVDLRPKFEPGQTTRYVMTVTSDNTVKPQDKQEPEQRQTITQEFTLSVRTVKSDGESGATVEIVFDRVKVRLKTDELDLSFDSDPAKSPPPAKGPRKDEIDEAMEGVLRQAFQGMVGQKLTVVYDGNGNIKSVEGGGGLGLPGLMDKAGVGSPKDAVGGIFGPITTRKSGGGLVSVGEKWQNVDEVSVGPFGEFRMVTDHQLRSSRDGRAEVTFNGRVEPASAAPGAAPVSVKGGGSRGMYVWDTRLGQLRSMTSEQQMNLEGTKGGLGSMSSTQTVKVERVEGQRK